MRAARLYINREGDFELALTDGQRINIGDYIEGRVVGAPEPFDYSPGWHPPQRRYHVPFLLTFSALQDEYHVVFDLSEFSFKQFVDVLTSITRSEADDEVLLPIPQSMLPTLKIKPRLVRFANKHMDRTFYTYKVEVLENVA